VGDLDPSLAEENGKVRRAVPVEALADAAQAFAARVRQLGAEPKRALELAREAFESLRVW